MTETLSTLLNFTVLVTVLWYFGRKPIKDFFTARSASIAALVNEARGLSADDRKALEEWNAKMLSAPAEIELQLEDAKASMAKQRQTSHTRAGAEAKRIAEESAVMEVAQTVKAKRWLRRRLAMESLDRARHYLAQNVDERDSGKLLTDYLEKIDHAVVR